MRPVLSLSLACTLALAACQGKAPAPAPVAAPVVVKHAPAPTAVPEPAAANRMHDESSYAEPDVVRVTHLALDLAVDFDKKQLSGTATLDLNWHDLNAHPLVLDTRDLAISKIEGNDGTDTWSTLAYVLAPRDPVLGSKLTITMPKQMLQVRITYATSPQASGLQWLEPSMTEGKKLPFMFSQSEAIHARSWIPLQDTPGVRFTYAAHITTPKEVMALMSADNGMNADNDPAIPHNGDYKFTMAQQVPSYLLAIAVGDLVFKRISDRSGVWAEPEMAPRAKAEFADTEKMIKTTEDLYGPYRWTRYDILVLPPSFPFGGMENPRLTFATPTVIVGDKSLVSLVAHELAHSWSGNLVTNASWKDIWLNEGFTTYVQSRITEALYGKDVAEMERVIDQGELGREIADEDIKPADQVLMMPPLTGRDPDDALSDIAYTKGAWFLQFLEQRFGRQTFDTFLRSYFDNFAFHSISSDQFEAYLRANLLPKDPKAVTDAELHEWLYEPGIPAFAMRAASERFNAVDAARKAWLDSGTLPAADATGKWMTQEWVRFLEGMPDKLTAGQSAALDKAYHFSGTPNGEIAQRWYPLAVRSGDMDARPGMAAFLQQIGRRKLIMPTYEALAKTQEGLAFAKDVFTKAKPGYHPITATSVEDLLGKAKPAQ
ncbi:MAG TPA: M1 family metallopeptidase [Xanthomonadaceae bacterium]|nr:M1 family metallopeptidase [Xanthomonadaceae bacterium]